MAAASETRRKRQRSPQAPDPASHRAQIAKHENLDGRGQHLKQVLLEWLTQASEDPELELEARVKDIQPAGFQYTLQKLRECREWSSTSHEVTVDCSYTGNVRGSRPLEGGGQEAFIRKRRLHKRDEPHHAAKTVAGPVRFSLQRELPHSGQGRSPAGFVRVKDRHSFVVGHRVRYDLTQVRSGTTLQDALAATAVPEVEVEWCGRAALASLPPHSEPWEQAAARHLTAFLKGVRDLQDMHARGVAKAAQAAAAAAGGAGP